MGDQCSGCGEHGYVPNYQENEDWVVVVELSLHNVLWIRAIWEIRCLVCLVPAAGCFNNATRSIRRL